MRWQGREGGRRGERERGKEGGGGERERESVNLMLKMLVQNSLDITDANPPAIAPPAVLLMY